MARAELIRHFIRSKTGPNAERRAPNAKQMEESLASFSDYCLSGRDARGVGGMGDLSSGVPASFLSDVSTDINYYGSRKLFSSA